MSGTVPVLGLNENQDSKCITENLFESEILLFQNRNSLKKEEEVWGEFPKEFRRSLISSRDK